MDNIQPGQFDDAPEESLDLTYVDRDAINFPPPSESEDSLSSSEDNVDSDYRVEDEDWEISERDFTKHFNRLRQHVAVRTGNAQGVTSSMAPSTLVAPLPAINHPRSSTVTPGRRAHPSDEAAALTKYTSRIAKIDAPYMGAGVNRKGPSATANMKDKADRATVEQVLDSRTRTILFKMIRRELIHEVNGCISTGKEANVYHALALNPVTAHFALKVYKTSILIFKDRDKYVTGDYRFRRGYARHNPRKMVRLWAEKEMRNLQRLRDAGIPCPSPVTVKENVLVMEFLGDEDGWPSPRLKDAIIPDESCTTLYTNLLLLIRKMYHECNLVHADLSEYNIIYHDSKLYLIDVSQSVECDHPHAWEFLRSDLKNVEEFWRRGGVQTLGLRKAFEFVVTDEFASGPEATLEEWMELVCQTGEDEDDEGLREAKAAHEDQVFMQSFLPRKLAEVYDPEREIASRRQGDEKALGHAKITGVEPVEIEERLTAENAAVTHESGDEGAETGERDSFGDAEEQGFEPKKSRGHRHEDPDAKRERKQAVKAEAREKRQNKMPKAEKKRRIKASSKSK